MMHWRPGTQIGLGVLGIVEDHRIRCEPVENGRTHNRIAHEARHIKAVLVVHKKKQKFTTVNFFIAPKGGVRWRGC